MSKELSEDEKADLHRQLVRLGDMMGDGLHHEPDGKWISREYRKICVALGIIQRRPRCNNSGKINEAMIRRVKEVKCSGCGGELKQVRSGSMKTACIKCGAKFTLLKAVKKSQPTN